VTPLPDRTAQVFIAIVLVVVWRDCSTPVPAYRQPRSSRDPRRILLGASALGQFHDAAAPSPRCSSRLTWCRSSGVRQPRLVIFMFIIGLELDLKLIKGQERRAGVISLSSILVPFVGGALLALYLYNSTPMRSHDGHHVKKLAFALFIGASMCVTAFRLARILNERGMTRTPLGVIGWRAPHR